MARIVEINAACNTGSTGRIAEAIGLLAQENGHEVLLVHGGRYVRPSQLPTYPTQSRLMDYVHYALSLVSGRHGHFSLLATQRLVRRLRQFRPDIVHLHNIHGYYLHYPTLMRYLQEANIPVVWTLHDSWTITGHCACYGTETGICLRWQTGCHHCPKRADYPRAWLDRSAADYRCKQSLFTSLERLTLVPVSHWLEKTLHQSYLRDKTTQVIHNGIDLSTFYPRADRQQLRRQWGIARDRYILLGVASQWTARKGLADILELATLKSCQLILVGLTPRQRKQLPANVIGIEHTENASQLADLYAMADLFVNPTYADTFPTTNLEAMACGTPVLTYHTDGSPETLTTHTGFVVERGDRRALKDAVLYLQHHPMSRQECAEYAHSHYDRQERYQDYIKLYEQILQQ